MKRFLLATATIAVILTASVVSAKIQWLPTYLGEDMDKSTGRSYLADGPSTWRPEDSTYESREDATGDVKNEGKCPHGLFLKSELDKIAAAGKARDCVPVASYPGIGICYGNCKCNTSAFKWAVDAGECSGKWACNGNTCKDTSGTRYSNRINQCLEVWPADPNATKYQCKKVYQYCKDEGTCEEAYGPCESPIYKDYKRKNTCDEKLCDGGTLSDCDEICKGKCCEFDNYPLYDDNVTGATEYDSHTCGGLTKYAVKTCGAGYTKNGLTKCDVKACPAGTSLKDTTTTCGTAPKNSEWTGTTSTKSGDYSGENACYKCKSECSGTYRDSTAKCPNTSVFTYQIVDKDTANCGTCEATGCTSSYIQASCPARTYSSGAYTEKYKADNISCGTCSYSCTNGNSKTCGVSGCYTTTHNTTDATGCGPCVASGCATTCVAKSSCTNPTNGKATFSGTASGSYTCGSCTYSCNDYYSLSDKTCNACDYSGYPLLSKSADNAKEFGTSAKCGNKYKYKVTACNTNYKVNSDASGCDACTWDYSSTACGTKSDCNTDTCGGTTKYGFKSCQTNYTNSCGNSGIFTTTLTDPDTMGCGTCTINGCVHISSSSCTDPTNGKATLVGSDTKNNITCGTSCSYSCDDGYELSGSSCNACSWDDYTLTSNSGVTGAASYDDKQCGNLTRWKVETCDTTNGYTGPSNNTCTCSRSATACTNSGYALTSESDANATYEACVADCTNTTYQYKKTGCKTNYAEPNKDCASLGYTESSCSSGMSSLKCPYDSNKKFCYWAAI